MNKNYSISKTNLLSSKPSTAIRLLLMVLFIALSPLVSFGQSTQTFNTPGTYTFTVPSGVTSITVEAWGAGGGGGNGGGGGGNGGGGGGYAKSTFAVTPGSTYYYTVGLGGLANNNGGNSILESANATLLVASGGKSGGAGGNTNTGTITFNGGSGGANSSNSNKGGAGGGSAAGNDLNGNNGSVSSSNLGSNGGAAMSGGGAGGAGGNSFQNGLEGFSPGGGGGGGGQQGGGGSGGKGQVIIAYACPTSTLTTTGVSICAGGSGSLSVSGTCSDLVTTKATNAGVATSGGGTGSLWGNLPGATADDNSFANSQIGGSLSRDLLATNYGFSIPANAIINGIQVIIGRRANRSNSLSDNKLYLRIGGIATGTNKALPSTIWSTTETVANYGSNSDLWGTTTLTPAIINAANFGVVLAVINNKDEDTTASVNYIQITVTYTLPGSIQWYTVSSGGTPIGSGTSFNPVEAAGSGLVNTNSAGTTTFYAECSANPGCRTATNYVINALPIIPEITKNDIDCNNSTGSITILVQNVGETYSFDNGISFQQSNRKTGLAVGSYNVLIKSASGCNSESKGPIAIENKSSTTWNGTASGWSNGVPSITSNIIFDAFYSLPEDGKLEGCSCEVKTGKSVIINEGATLKIYNGVSVLGTGYLTFENNASLVQVNDAAANIGSIDYKRRTAIVRVASDYTYWSSPVENQNLLVVSPNTNQARFWSYDPGTGWVVQTPSTTTMDVGKGYIIRAPEFFSGSPAPPSSSYPVTFTGIPNNGIEKIAVGAAGTYNLLGNPYPSAIDAVKFLDLNSSVLGGTIYFWTHNTGIRDKTGASNEGSGDLVFIQDDYASFNRTGGLATVADAAITDPNPSAPKRPNGMIAAGQSFFTTSIAAGGGTVTFNNDMRIGATYLNNTQFFKTKSSSKQTADEDKSRIWLNLTNKQGAFKQTLVGYINGATNDYDTTYDGVSFNANAIINFYSVNAALNLAIQGRALPFDATDLVVLGYSSTIEGNFSISTDDVDGIFTAQQVFLEDKLTNVIHNLTSKPYDFQTEKGTFNERFVLRYTDKTLAVGDLETTNMQVVVSVKNKQLKVTSSAETISEVHIFDLLGKQLYVNKNIENKQFTVPNFISSEQVLIVKTVLQDGKVVTSKTIFK